MSNREQSSRHVSKASTTAQAHNMDMLRSSIGKHAQHSMFRVYKPVVRSMRHGSGKHHPEGMIDLCIFFLPGGWTADE